VWSLLALCIDARSLLVVRQTTMTMIQLIFHIVCGCTLPARALPRLPATEGDSANIEVRALVAADQEKKYC
jgi:hypothetical protein